MAHHLIVFFKEKNESVAVAHNKINIHVSYVISQNKITMWVS